MKDFVKKCIKKLTGRYLKGIFRVLSDKVYISMMFFYSYGYFPNFKNPVTFDEKLQWYKLYYRKDEMTRIADKFEVRQYVTGLGLGHILNELYFVSDRLYESDIKKLPEKYVIKATHGCEMNIIQNGRNNEDLKAIVKRANKWLKENYFYHGREWAYKNIKPQIIAEKYLENKEFNQLIDYKFYCYDGKPVVVFACAGRFSEKGVGYNAYDMDWNQIYMLKGKPGVDIEFQKPCKFDEMKEYACILSGNYPFVRVDLYQVEGNTIFGELTFYPDSGIIPFTPDKYNYYFGNLFKLPQN